MTVDPISFKVANDTLVGTHFILDAEHVGSVPCLKKKKQSQAHTPQKSNIDTKKC